MLESIPRLFRNVKRALIFLILVIIGLLMLSPFYISLLMSVKTPSETFKSFYQWPSHIHFENFIKAWNESNFPTAFMNSLIITSVSVVLIVIVSSLAGYSIARRNTKFYNALYVLFLSGMMIPFQITMVPLYKMAKMLGMIDTYWGIILLYGCFGPQMAIFLYTGFIKAIPKELEEAARIDGCSTPRIFFSIILPLLKPVTATVVVINALYIWNDFLLPLLFLQSDTMHTLPLQQYYFFGQYSTQMNLAFSSAILGMIPIIVFFFVMQKFIIKGITAGSVKG